MGEPQTSFYDFGISGRVPEPQNQYYLSLETSEYFNKSKQNPKSFPKHMFWKFRHLRHQQIEVCGKDGHRQMMKIRFINS